MVDHCVESPEIFLKDFFKEHVKIELAQLSLKLKLQGAKALAAFEEDGFTLSDLIEQRTLFRLEANFPEQLII